MAPSIGRCLDLREPCGQVLAATRPARVSSSQEVYPSIYLYVCLSAYLPICVSTYVYTRMLTPPTTRKNAHFAHLSITVIRQRLRTAKSPKIQKPQNPKIQKQLQDSVDVKSFGFLDFSIFGFRGFWIFGFCFFVFYTCVSNL